MTWESLVEIIRRESGAETSDRIEAAIRRDLAGARITLAPRRPVSRKLVEEAAPGKPQIAAARLNIHRSTAYRALKRKPLR